MHRLLAKSVRFVLPVLITGPALAAGPTYINRVWHYPQGQTPYYTIEDATLASSTWDTAGSPYICEANVSIPTGFTLTVSPGAEIHFGAVSGLYVGGTLTATSAIFTTTGGAADYWKGIYLAPTAGGSSIANCAVSVSGGVGYCNYGCGGLGNYHGAIRYAALYVDGCNASITGCTFTNTYAHALEIWGGTPVVTGNTFTNVGAGYYAIAYDNPDVFPVISGNSGSGTGGIGVSVPAGTTTASGHWPVPGPTMPYFISGHYTIGAGQSLSIDPGVTVSATPGDTGIYALGVLKAQGTVGAPIVFTSRSAAPAAGDWIGIYVGPDSGATAVVNCGIHYAGGAGYCYYGCRGHGVGNGMNKYAAIFVDASSPTIKNNAISGTYGHGVEVWNGKPLVKDNAFSNINASSYPVCLDTADTYPVMSGNILSGTGYAGAYSPGGTLTSSGTWNSPGAGLNWYLGSSITIPSGTALTIDPGNTVYIPPGNNGIYVAGTLAAPGTGTALVTFTSRAATPTAGDWNGVYLAPTAGASNLRNARVLYAGGVGYCSYGCGGLGTYNGAARMAGVYVDACNPILDGLTVTDTYGNGLEMYNSAASLNGATIARARQSGLLLDGGASPDVSGTSVLNCGSGNFWAVSMDAACRPNPTNVTFTGNTYQGILVRGGTFTANTRWKQWAPTAPYVISGTATVADGATLTLDPSVTVKCWNAAIYVLGTLVADGSAGGITFTSMRDDTVAGDTDPNPASPTTGEWLGIYFGPHGGASVLNRCTIRYPSAYNGGTGLINVHGSGRYAAVFVDGCSPTITNCTIKSVYGHGIELWASSAVIKNNAIIDVDSGSWSIVQRTTDTFPVYADNTASGTGNLGVWLVNGQMTASGRWYRPGVSLPYYVSNLLQVNEGVTLTIDAGTTMQYASALYVYGTLNAQGSPSQPITFTSRADSAAGQWLGVYLGPKAGASTLKWLRLRNGSAFNYDTGLINVHGEGQNCIVMVDSCSPALDNISINNAYYNGLVLWGSNSAVTNSVFYGCGWSGISVRAASAPTLTGVTTTANDTGIYTNASAFTLVNSIAAFNRLGVNSGGANTPTFRYCDIYGNSGGNFSGVTDPGTANGNIRQDPLFVYSAGSNFRLSAGSPCTDAGDDSAAMGTGVDILGGARKQGAHVDMGAFESPASGNLCTADVIRAVRIASGITKAGAPDMARLDVLGDSSITLGDAVKILRIVTALDPVL